MILCRAIKPAKVFQSSIFREEVLKEANAIKKDMTDDFRRITDPWEHKVKWKSEVKTVGTQSVTISVTTTDKVFDYLDRGTKKHIIRPKNKKALAFNKGYVTKTQPHVILSTPGGAKKSRGKKKDVVTQLVHHPGTKAREFSKDIKRSYSKLFRQRIQNALDRAAKRTGHVINK